MKTKKEDSSLITFPFSNLLHFPLGFRFYSFFFTSTFIRPGWSLHLPKDCFTCSNSTISGSFELEDWWQNRPFIHITLDQGGGGDLVESKKNLINIGLLNNVTILESKHVLDFVNNFSFFDRYLSLSRFSPVLNTFPFQDSLGLL